MHATQTDAARKKNAPIERESYIAEKTKTPRKSRAKRCILWDEYANRDNSLCHARVERIAKRFPRKLTPHQLRVAVLAMDLLPTRKIASILGVTDHAVEKVRSRIRIMLKIKSGVSIAAFLFAKVA